MQNLIKHIEKLIKKDSRLVSKDKQVLKNKLIELVSSDDEKLLDLLLKDSEAKNNFFKKVGNSTVFLKDKFLQFATMNEFLPDSFTVFENEIGLSDDKKLITQKDEISLVFPHKDCMLEGGQTKEENGRDEIFYNTILAPDEIDRIKEPKVLTNWKKYDRNGSHEVKELSKQDNWIIKGNNLLALYSLLPKYRGEIKLIYIDPPYNTGSDSFKYNDRFNHSAWLTFMKNRLEVARELLSNSGVIFVHCDSNEQAYLKVLMDGIFRQENFIDIITVVNNPRGRDYGGIANMHEFINVYSKSSEYELYRLEDKNKEFPFEDSIGGFEIRELRNRNIAFNKKNRPNLFYPFYLNPKSVDKNGFYEIGLDKKSGWIQVMPAKSQGVQTVWRWGKDKARKETNQNICGKKIQNGGWQIVEKYREKATMARSVWWDKTVNSERGTLHIKALFNGKVFNHPKPEETLWRIIEMATKRGDIVLDFFAGTGTTGAVALKTGRRFILCEQMDYVEKLTTKRLEKTINGEQGGISKIINWKGGGSFIYTELLEWNQKHINQLEEAKIQKQVLTICKKIEKEQFYRYKYEPKKFDSKKFQQLDLKKQKEVLIDILDMNHLYVNKSSVDDTTFKVSEKDKALTKKFYKED